MSKQTPGPKEWLKEDWTVGQYTPTASFRTITNHSCVCKKSDMGLIAITGPAEDEESQKLSDLFAASPKTLEALKKTRKALALCRRWMRYYSNWNCEGKEDEQLVRADKDASESLLISRTAIAKAEGR